MYLWKVDQLVEDFRNDSVTEKEKFKYMLLMGIVFTVISDPILFLGTRYTAMDTINLLTMLFVVAWGTHHCYVSNRNGDNKDFITRFTCVGVPVAVRVFAVAIPVFVVIGVIEGVYKAGIEVDESGAEIYVTTAGQIISAVVFSLVGYIYLGLKLRAIGVNLESDERTSADTRNSRRLES